MTWLKPDIRVMIKPGVRTPWYSGGQKGTLKEQHYESKNYWRVIFDDGPPWWAVDDELMPEPRPVDVLAEIAKDYIAITNLPRPE